MGPIVAEESEGLNRENTISLAREVAKEVLESYREEEKVKKRKRVFRNTKLLMENYNAIRYNVENGVSEVVDLDLNDILPEDMKEEQLFISSIRRSKIRSLIMVTHIEKCLIALKKEQDEKNTPEKYNIFVHHYLKKESLEASAEVFQCAEITARRWCNEMINRLSVHIFGIDGIKLE